MKRGMIIAAWLAVGIAGASAATLDTVKQRGQLVCGVSLGFAGFSMPDSQGNFKGLDVDYCRALAAGVLGDPSKVRYLALTAQNRFTALQSGEIDVLYRNSTQTFLRGTTLGLRQGPVNFYDGQGFVVKKDSGVKELKDLTSLQTLHLEGSQVPQASVALRLLAHARPRVGDHRIGAPLLFCKFANRADGVRHGRDIEGGMSAKLARHIKRSIAPRQRNDANAAA